MVTAFKNATLFTGMEVVTGKVLLTEGEYILGIVSPGAIPDDSVTIDCKGLNLAPGLIDLQIAGGGGCLFSSSPTPESLKKIIPAIIKSGTTAFLISLPTNSFEVYQEAFNTLKNNPDKAVLGLHLEGPYISTSKRGAHIREMIRKPVRKEIEDLLTEANGVVRMMTVAPEVCDAEIIDLLINSGLVVAAGHSNATFIEAINGFDKGVHTVTHLFNAMSPVHHRDPGLPGAAFLSDKVFASIIADGIHVDYNMISITKKIMKERLYLVSDAVEENTEGAYKHIRQNDRFILHDGTLSGAKLSLFEAVRNCVSYAGIPLEEALRMASAYPAKVIGDSERGYLTEGCRADLISFNDGLELSEVYLGGVPF